MTNEKPLSPALAHINLDEYPIHDLQSEKGKKMVADGRQQLAENGACAFPNFLRPGVANMLAEEAKRIEKQAVRRNYLNNTYSEEVDSKYPMDHPRNRRHQSSVNVLAYDQIKDAKMQLNEIYQLDELKEAIRQVLGLDALHHYEDEFQSLNTTFTGDGDQLGWHYDFNDFVVTLLLQSSDVGGEFEFAPNIRDKAKNEENYADVEALFDGRYEGTQIMSQTPGTLVLFQGVNSMHRVRTVYGAKKRIMSILGYSRLPKQKSNIKVNAYLYGLRAAKKMAKKEPLLKRLFVELLLFKHRKRL